MHKLEKLLTESQIPLFRRRMAEDYNLGEQGDPLYDLWKNLVMQREFIITYTSGGKFGAKQ